MQYGQQGGQTDINCKIIQFNRFSRAVNFLFSLFPNIFFVSDDDLLKTFSDKEPLNIFSFFQTSTPLC